jgi:hypothetical protein
MSDFILLDGDQALFSPQFGAALVVVGVGALSASGPTTVGGAKVCVAGDESSVSVPGCAYTTPQHTIVGTGTLEVAALAADHTAQKTCSGGTSALLLGGTFTARFKVDVPAQQPPPGAGSPVPDAAPEYFGTGFFLSTNRKFKGL